MLTLRIWAAATFSAFFSAHLTAAVLYVDVNSTNSIVPYTNWSTAATVIQDAVDSAVAGDTVLVTNGVYQSGGRAVYGVLTNRVAITKSITVQSVNGAAETIIQGIQIPAQSSENTNGYKSVRCAYLTNNAVLSGFTLTNGGTWTVSENLIDQSGAGTLCETNARVRDCVITSNMAYTSGGGAYQGRYSNCVFLNNTVFFMGGGAFNSILDNCTLSMNQQIHPNLGGGGGAYSSTMNNCVLSGNSSAANDHQTSGGGGVLASTLTNCTLAGNSAAFDGGGANASTLYNCTISNNIAGNWGGGAYRCVLVNSTIRANSASSGGGALYGSLTNCSLIENTSPNGAGGADHANLVNCVLYGNYGYGGGGARGGTLVNCTVCSNSASAFGGGVALTVVSNSVIFFNDSPLYSNYEPSSTLNYCCTLPQPSDGAGNITDDPLFVDLLSGNLRLQSNSPCINSGFNGGAPVVDLDGNPRIVAGTVDIGAYEFQNPTSKISYAWLDQYGLPTDGSADFTDPDQDGMNNWQEWIAGTDPTNAASSLRLISVANSTNGIAVTWQSEPTRNYFLLGTTNFTGSSSFSVLATNILGQTNTTIFFDTNSAGAAFYRVGVQP